MPCQSTLPTNRPINLLRGPRIFARSPHNIDPKPFWPASGFERLMEDIMTRWFVGAALTLTLCANISAGATQTNSAPTTTSPSSQLGPEMQKLSPLTGSWRGDLETYRPKLQRWDRGDSVTLAFVPKFGGRYLETEFVVTMGSAGYIANIAFSYDQFRKEYRAFFREDVFGLLDIFEGQFDGDTLYVDNRQTGTMGPSASGKLEPNRMSIRFDGNDRFILMVQAWRDGQWVDGLRYTFMRVKPFGQ
jgi:Protein of unknown function (DUF1579)